MAIVVLFDVQKSKPMISQPFTNSARFRVKKVWWVGEFPGKHEIDQREGMFAAYICFYPRDIELLLRFSCTFCKKLSENFSNLPAFLCFRCLTVSRMHFLL